MALIQRFLKTAGTRRYSDEVAAGAVTGKASEVDGDFDIIYADHNGGITDANLSPGAAIQTAKIAPDGGLVDAHLSPTAAIAGTKLADAPNGVPTAKYNALSITTPKLAIGAALNTRQQAVVTTNVVAGPADTVVCTLPALTSRGGPIQVIGTVSGQWTFPGTLAGAALILHLKRNGVTVGQWQGSAIGFSSSPIIPMFLPVLFVEQPGAGVYTYTVTVANTGAAPSEFRTDPTNAGAVFALELA